EEVLEIYAAGGRNITEGEHAGDGRANPYKSTFVFGFDMTEQEKEDVLAFLRSLTDESFIENPRFSNPFE
ncbi:MAG: di-heme enzyme, partial [Myxococcota bacterium]